MHFGEHVTVDGYDGAPHLLDNRAVVEECLSELCQLLGMHPLAPALVINAPDNHLKDPGGWSGFLVISESHLAVHTFPKRRFLSADVYTCRNGMDSDTIKAFFVSRFELQDVELNFIKRGLRYPLHNIA